MAKDKKKKRNRGPQVNMTEELFEDICFLIATSTHGLKKICDENQHLPDFRTLFYWINKPVNKSYLDRYTRAKEHQSDIMADEMKEVAFDTNNDTMQDERGRYVENREWINRSRLKVDTLKWIASHLKPKKYGDKLDLTTDGEKIQAPVIIDWSGKKVDKK